MGRGTAILRFGSALHSRRFPGPSTERLFRWLEAQLDMRGVDPALYSRYLISLLQLDDADFERSETSDHELDGSIGGGGRRSSGRRSRRRRQQQQQQQPSAAAEAVAATPAAAAAAASPPQPTAAVCDAAIGLASGVSSRKRAAAVRCLQSACNDPYEVDELIDELCYRLKRLNSSSSSGGLLQQQQQQQLPLLLEEEAANNEQEEEEETNGAATAGADSGRAGTPDGGGGADNGSTDGRSEETAEASDEAAAEDYVCAFPALSQIAEQRRESHRQLQQHQQLRFDRLQSAWARGPPRALRRRLRQLQQQQQQQKAAEDEGFLDGEAELHKATNHAGEEYDDEEDTDDEDEEEEEERSVASEGSEILQLVSHILHSFNRELEDEQLRLASATAAAAANSAEDNSSATVGAAAAAASFAEGSGGSEDHNGTYGALLTASAMALMMMDGDAEVLSDHDFDNLPNEEEPPPAAEFELDDVDADVDPAEGTDDSKEEEPDNCQAMKLNIAAAAGMQPAPTASVTMATGVVALPAEVVVSGMARWTPLDRLRHQMWSRKPLPPKPQQQQQQPRRRQTSLNQQPHQPQHQLQPMTPQEKSKRACSFLLRGRCKKEDCEFAHDLGRVTCKFWSAGECFKGDTCPFLHGEAVGAGAAEEGETAKAGCCVGE